uniref:23S rRNA (uracil(1939)-C(5))-methyltransferase RlmD n=1 Tax=Eubacterium cellulosolvens TaxID=29322 RepID=UPI000AA94DB5|nr:23S rRNA (uracil(1939)-C(5))-methyltransferase RlmD [[Eubacterium] cellulosolvens]
MENRKEKNRQVRGAFKRADQKREKVGAKEDRPKENRRKEDRPKENRRKEVRPESEGKPKSGVKCRIDRKCGGCVYLRHTYEEQLAIKEKQVRLLMDGIAKVRPVTGMEDPFHYRNKVNAAFQRKRDGKIVSGIYEEGTHNVIPVTNCLIEDRKADEIIGTIRKLALSFKVRIFDEDHGSGLLRHVMIRRGHVSGQILVILVVASPVFPSKNNFVKALRAAHPEITSVVLNINDKQTSMVLGSRNITLYGKGYIEDTLCGCKFRISPSSFYQINSVQTEKLYGKAIELAELGGKETVFDAYCGIGTIGITASSKAGRVIGVELNKQAVRDAAVNAKLNSISNIRFYADDAGRFLTEMAERGEKADVLFMDPPRSGSTEVFMKAAVDMEPLRIVYVSCDPETMARDLRFLRKEYTVGEIWPFDMFPWTKSIECVTVLTRKSLRKPSAAGRTGQAKKDVKSC